MTGRSLQTGTRVGTTGFEPAWSCSQSRWATSTPHPETAGPATTGTGILPGYLPTAQACSPSWPPCPPGKGSGGHQPWRLQASNLRPSGCKPDALPTELSPLHTGHGGHRQDPRGKSTFPGNRPLRFRGPQQPTTVGIAGLEPATSWPPARRATRLRHIPVLAALRGVPIPLRFLLYARTRQGLAHQRTAWPGTGSNRRPTAFQAVARTN